MPLVCIKCLLFLFFSFSISHIASILMCISPIKIIISVVKQDMENILHMENIYNDKRRKYFANFISL